MLGRGIGISEEKLRHMGDDPLPDGVYSEAEAAIVRYAQRSQITNRFNATFLSDVDDYILDANKKADGAAGSARFTIRRCRLSSPTLKQNQTLRDCHARACCPLPVCRQA